MFIIQEVFILVEKPQRKHIKHFVTFHYFFWTLFETITKHKKLSNFLTIYMFDKYLIYT